MKYILTMVAAVALSLGLTLSVNAQCATSGKPIIFTYPTTNQFPVKEVIVKDHVVVKEIITPVAVPVLIPAFQFQYVSPCAAPVAGVPYGQPVATPYVGQPMQPMAYGPQNVGNPVAPQQPVVSDKEKIRALAKALLAEMNKEAEGQGGGAADDGPPVAVGDIFGGGDGHDHQPPQQLNPLAVLQNRCGSCHTGATAKSGVMIFSGPGQFNQSVDRQRLISAIEQGRMPPQAASNPQFKLSPQEIAAIKSGL